MTPEPTGGDYEQVDIDDWDALTEALRRFAGSGSVEEDEASITVRTGSAHVTVSRDGTVETGMPLHGFEAQHVEALYVDFDRGRIQIRDPQSGLEYEFRRP